MKRLDPTVLKELLESNDLSLAVLAKQARIDKQTVWRLSAGKVTGARDRTIKQIAEVLKVDPQVLTGEMPPPKVSHESQPATSKSQLNLRVSDAARNALILVAQRYGVEQSQIVEIAPFLFCWAAEESLRQRQENVFKVEVACESARNLEQHIRYLPVPNFTYSEEKIVAEQESIDRRDLFGSWIFEKANFLDPAFDCDRDTDNPFAMFLRNLVAGFGHVVTFEGWPSDWIPQYRVCPDEAAQIVDGDHDRANEILAGLAALNEIPKDIRGKPEMAKARADWVREKAKENQKQALADL
jgi:transcriptional regulator with XRE-family HTH domain